MKLLKILLITSLLVCMFFSTSCSSDKKETLPETKEYTPGNVTSSGDEQPHTRVCFEVENYGNFVVETYPEHAPETVNHFLKLVEEGFYNGFTFEEVVPGFKLQTGETSSVTNEECKETVTGEFFKNGITNDLKLTKGVLAMNYTPNEFNSAKAKFMILLSDTHGLDGWFGGFAMVVEGIEVIDKIASAGRDNTNKPLSPIVMKNVYIME